MIDAVWVCHERLPRPLRSELWSRLRLFADEATAHWRDRDHGPWEVRSEARHYLYSKLRCWVALDRAVRIAGRRGEADEHVSRWRQQRDEVRRAILTRGYDEQVGAFTYVLDEPTLDAGALAIPLVRFLRASDPRVISTMAGVHARLSVDGLVYRNFTEDLKGEGTFTLCSYWLGENLALVGRLDDARALFERIGAHANDLGLQSEQIDARTGELLGNFPQGYTHLAMIRAAVRLADAERLGHSGAG